METKALVTVKGKAGWADDYAACVAQPQHRVGQCQAQFRANKKDRQLLMAGGLKKILAACPKTQKGHRDRMSSRLKPQSTVVEIA